MNDEELRALLADARVSEPMPDDVADRLDGVLAGLSAERARDAEGPDQAEDTETGASGVTDLAAARQRRRGRTWLGAAAAAVVVVTAGITLPQVLGGDSGSMVTADEMTADRGTAPTDDAGSGAESGTWSDTEADTVVELTSAGLREEVTAHLAASEALAAPGPAAAADRADGADEPEESTSGRSTKVRPQRTPMSGLVDPPCRWTGPGELSAATFDGEPATLVTRSTAAGTVVRVVTCADGESVVTERLVLDSAR